MDIRPDCANVLRDGKEIIYVYDSKGELDNIKKYLR